MSVLRAMQREVHVEELAEMLDVSTITVRRDLENLAGEQKIIRTHGGCLYVGRAALETEYHQKVRSNFSLKQAVGQAASDLVDEGDLLLLNDGSTTFHLAACIGNGKKLTVFTNSLAMVTELSRYDCVELYILGGKYSSQQYSLRGSLIEQILENYVFDKVFLGADAIDEKGRCFVASPEEARLTELMLRSGRKKILLADHTKICAESNCVYGNLSTFDYWVTTSGISSAIYKELSEKTDIMVASILD